MIQPLVQHSAVSCSRARHAAHRCRRDVAPSARSRWARVLARSARSRCARVVTRFARSRCAALTLTLAFGTAACTRTVHLDTVETTPDMRTQQVLRSTANLPAAFTVVTPASTPGDCPPRLADPDLRTTLNPRRAVTLPADSAGRRAIGDYVVSPVTAYGAEPGDLLRVDCRRLSALGLIRP